VEVRLPLLAARGEQLSISLPLPPLGRVPPGFVYVPAGRFLSGTAVDEEVRRFYEAAPLHSIETGSYLIARQEVTFGEWLVWLRALPAAERAARLPGVQQSPSTPGAELRLSQGPDGRFRLMLKPGEDTLSAAEGELIRYPRRTLHPQGDWLRFPVTGISADDAEAYTAWLRAAGRLPTARVCTEREWERAARGADGRAFPTGADLPLEAANLDATHGRGSQGPDEVGSHPASRSVFGVDDLAGGAWELTRSSLGDGEYILRGGSFFHERINAQSANRNVLEKSWRDATVGLRLCADL
jgi:formylglycine-generating enzyme required for sulfatase activity